MRMGELTYTTTKIKKAIFVKTSLTRSALSFAKED